MKPSKRYAVRVLAGYEAQLLDGIGLVPAPRSGRTQTL